MVILSILLDTSGGSLTCFNQNQFHGLALRLELFGRPFLWVVRPYITTKLRDAYLDGFQVRVTTRSKIVGWAPQQKVLSHPSISYFLTHCGWNSIMEAISCGVPFHYWPNFVDQFMNQNYVCDVWKVGLGLVQDATREEIKDKVEELLCHEGIRIRISELGEMARKSVQKGGNSHNNLGKLVEEMN
ncbi:hypothetical protein GIB67_000712 [Kingdonia uniflora]|uniref:Uncharacterized protein n=1 Tax=Kingdonia uniflora TaxID=39325 RepID=A0A7J7NE30_9MAGN|nr:hypothetical protein GIB67_000712 [Kingdonia uniflora]